MREFGKRKIFQTSLDTMQKPDLRRTESSSAADFFASDSVGYLSGPLRIVQNAQSATGTSICLMQLTDTRNRT